MPPTGNWSVGLSTEYRSSSDLLNDRGDQESMTSANCWTSDGLELTGDLLNRSISMGLDGRQAMDLLCEHARLRRKLLPRVRAMIGVAQAIGSVIGTLSAALCVLIFRQKEMRNVSFFYLLVINWTELIYMLFVLESSVHWYLLREPDWAVGSWAWARFLTYFHAKLDMSLPTAVHLLIVWLAVERVVACCGGRCFSRINRRTVARLVSLVSLLASAGLYAPTAFNSAYVFNDSSQLYEKSQTDFGRSSAYKSYVQLLAVCSYTETTLVFVAAVATVAGFCRSSRIKRKCILYGNSSSFVAQIHLNRQLCYLQLCESLPVALSCVLTAVLRGLPFVPADPARLFQLPYDQARRHLTLYERALHMAVWQTVSDLVAHCTHFLRYMLFSRRFRRVVMRLLRKKLSANTNFSGS